MIDWNNVIYWWIHLFVYGKSPKHEGRVNVDSICINSMIFSNIYSSRPIQFFKLQSVRNKPCCQHTWKIIITCAYIYRHFSSVDGEAFWWIDENESLKCVLIHINKFGRVFSAVHVIEMNNFMCTTLLKCVTSFESWILSWIDWTFIYIKHAIITM